MPPMVWTWLNQLQWMKWLILSLLSYLMAFSLNPMALARINDRGGLLDVCTQALARPPKFMAIVLLQLGTAGAQTWRDFVDRIQSVAAGLRGLALQPGDRVAILAGNTAEHLTMMYMPPKRLCAGSTQRPALG